MADVRTNLRIPEELYEEIKRIADREMRSINAQMVILLSAAVAQQKRREQRKTENNEENFVPSLAAA